MNILFLDYGHLIEYAQYINTKICKLVMIFWFLLTQQFHIQSDGEKSNGYSVLISGSTTFSSNIPKQELPETVD